MRVRAELIRREAKRKYFEEQKKKQLAALAEKDGAGTAGSPPKGLETLNENDTNCAVTPPKEPVGKERFHSTFQ